MNVNLRRFDNKLLCHRFLNLLRREKPDVIISTHFLVNELVSYLKGRGEINTRLLSIITDFGVHNFWLAENVDLYIAASYDTQDILISKNINKEKIRVLGIPIRHEFQKKIDKKSARQKLGISPDFTALILTGGIGMGPIYDIVKVLPSSINIIVICGTNKKLYSQLRQLNMPNLVVLGWIDYVQETMAASDIAITKPGGSTISECFAMDLPMIFFSIIPGQERQNAEIISKNGLGFILERPEQIRQKIIYLRDNPYQIEQIKKRIESFRFADSNQRILSLVHEQ
jgi:processive 1,2-diacylglycerol beta-glucosyltransferase